MLRSMSVSQNMEAVFDTIYSSKEPVTLSDLATIHDISYYTARNYVNQLIKDQRVKIARRGMGSRSNATGFEPLNKNTMPEMAGKKIWVVLQGVSHAITNKGNLPRLNNSFRVYLKEVTFLFSMAQTIVQGGKVREAELLQVRSRLLQQREELMKLVDGYDALLNHPKLWNPAEFWKILLMDDEMPVDQNELDRVRPIVETAAIKAIGTL